MLIQDIDALNLWLISNLGRMSEADPAMLAEYIIWLIKKDKPENELREHCLYQLEAFFLNKTNQFVDLLFETLKTKSYLYKTDNNIPSANALSLNNITVNSAKKLNSCDEREKTDLEKDYIPENVPKSKSAHFSSSKKDTKISGQIGRVQTKERKKIVEDNYKFKNVPKSKSAHFSSSEKHTKISGHVGQVQTKEKNKIVEDDDKCKKERFLHQPVSVPAAPVFPEITPVIENIINDILHTGETTDFICTSICNIELFRKDFKTLSGSSWLNDNIINSYFDLIVERSKKIEDLPSVFAFNTFFYINLKEKGYSAMRRWTLKVDLFNYDLNFVPLHVQSNHWALAVVDHRAKRIGYYDSLGNSEEECLNILHNYLCQEYSKKKGQTLDPSTYVKETMKDIPQQENDHDCGMFTLMNAEYISRNAEITFNQEHMQYFRKKTIYELVTNKFL